MKTSAVRTAFPDTGIHQLCSGGAAALRKRHTMLSIGVGMVCYMPLIQFVF